jgi:hypothetical protein
MNSNTLLLKYLGSIGDPDRAAALFAEDGALVLPFLRSLGVGARYDSWSAFCTRRLHGHLLL